MPGTTIKLFLVQGDPKRIRTAELSNWSGKAIAAPRSELDDLLKRKEMQGSGVYILIGRDEKTGEKLAYIGEAETLATRLRQHREKDFWVHAYTFFSKDENLTKGHIKYLEGRLIEEAKRSERMVLANSVASGAKLPESDREDMEVFLQKIVLMLPVLGSELLTPSAGQMARSNDKSLFTFSVKGVTARGAITPDGFVILSGSEAALKNVPSAAAFITRRRAELMQEGILVAKGDKYRFTKDVEFVSPSGAASVVRGGNTNGRISWKNSSGKTLKEIEEQDSSESNADC